MHSKCCREFFNNNFCCRIIRAPKAVINGCKYNREPAGRIANPVHCCGSIVLCHILACIFFIAVSNIVEYSLEMLCNSADIHCKTWQVWISAREQSHLHVDYMHHGCTCICTLTPVVEPKPTQKLLTWFNGFGSGQYVVWPGFQISVHTFVTIMPAVAAI